LLMEDHIVSLNGGGPGYDDALQVGGLPSRNPPISAAETAPFPSAGMLSYPSVDYSSDHSPVTGTHMAQAQPDYSTAPAGVVRSYVRTLDTAFANGAVVDRAGTTELVLRIDGITLDDITYRAPGPGGVMSDRIALMVKVPGLTTWMDCGRVDGGGPGKQDAILDGAGCLILDSQTYTFKDDLSGSGYMGCYLHINVGPVASLFVNPAALSAYTVGTPKGESPLMIKVLMNSGAASYNMERAWNGTGGGAVSPDFDAAIAPGAASRDVRGLFNISVVHPDDTLNVPFSTFVAAPVVVVP